jgi:F-type H+-transporting ATPase subunit b
VLSYVAAEGSDLRPITPIWQELVIGSIAFAVLVFVLGKYVWPRMDATFQARREATEGGLRKAEETRDKAAKLLEQTEQLLAEARTEAARIRDRARVDAAGMGEESAARAREEGDRIIHLGRGVLAAERGRVVHEVRAGIGGLAVELAGRIAGESLVDEVRRSGTVDRFLNDIGPGPAVGSR